MNKISKLILENKYGLKWREKNDEVHKERRQGKWPQIEDTESQEHLHFWMRLKQLRNQLKLTTHPDQEMPILR